MDGDNRTALSFLAHIGRPRNKKTAVSRVCEAAEIDISTANAGGNTNYAHRWPEPLDIRIANRFMAPTSSAQAFPPVFCIIIPPRIRIVNGFFEKRAENAILPLNILQTPLPEFV